MLNSILSFVKHSAQSVDAVMQYGLGEGELSFLGNSILSVMCITYLDKYLSFRYRKTIRFIKFFRKF